MKKNCLIALLLCLCIALTGCNYTGYAAGEYNSDKKIVRTDDHYAKSSSVRNPVSGGYVMTAEKFTGRETIDTITVGDGAAVDLTVSLTVGSGKAKVVFVDSNNNIITLAEKTPDSQNAVETLSLNDVPGGTCRIKLVGVDCRDVKVEVTSSVH